MQLLFEKDIRYLKGVGEKRAKLYKKLGVSNVGALLCFYPRAYEDWSKPFNLCEDLIYKTICVKAKVVLPVKKVFNSSKTQIYTATVQDEKSNNLFITWFNNSYVSKALKQGEYYFFYGKLELNFNKFKMISPEFASCDKYIKIKPIYSQTYGLSSKIISKNIKVALQLFGDEIKETISSDILKENDLCHFKEAIFNIHFPENSQKLDKAKERLIFEEFLTLQIGMMKLKNKGKSKKNFNIIDKDYSDEYLNLLPFEATSAQKKAIKECIKDLKSKNAMNRLIQGDVGSGKTAVAAALSYSVAKNKMQCAFMAPTEILATQHFNSINKNMETLGVKTALLTASTKQAKKKEILENLASGKIDIIIGTHAILNEKVKFENLGLIITDEQHRFGVNQRAILNKKGNNPHVLVMSATPIPRTLALMVYGELDISILDEMPKGRVEISTYWIDSTKEARAFNFIKKEIEVGHQAYIVCPLLEENESELVSAKQYFKNLSENYFKNYKIGLIHGKLNAKEKNKIMANFKKGEIKILVATTVIEVGVNIANATVMMIINAERFGLSQLHQLRGRVGRGEYKSYCILLSDAKEKTSQKRLATMCKTSDGFKIADEDLKLRGPGDFLGARQHGLPKFKIADLSTDTKILKKAQQAALKIINKDPNLDLEENMFIKNNVKLMFDQENFVLN